MGRGLPLLATVLLLAGCATSTAPPSAPAAGGLTVTSTDFRDGATIPAGARELANSAGSAGWTPPCPPSGTHHYRFTVYALKAPTGIPAGTSLGDAFDRITKAATAQGRLTGLVRH